MHNLRLHAATPPLRRLLASLCLVTLAFCTHPLSAQQPPPAGTAATGTYRIAGRVVSAADARGLEGAVLSITSTNARRPVAATVAGDRGTFVFEHLPAGKYSLLGEVRGFLSANYDQHDQFSTAIVTGAGFNTEALTLRLQPAARIAGRVLDESGEPVQGARLSLYREEYTTGAREIHRISSAFTDDRGDYTVGPLPDGRYFLTASAIPWYAVHPPTLPSPALGTSSGGSLPDDQQPASPILTGVDPTLDAAYPLTFFGDVTDSGVATPIPLKPGEQARADIRLKPVKAIRIAVPPPTPGTQVPIPSLRIPVFDGFEDANSQIQQGPSGAMELVGLAPARYQVQQRDQPGQTARIGTLDTTSGSTQIDPAVGEAAATLTLTVEEENGAKLPPQMQIVLRGTAADSTQGQVTDLKSEVHFSSLPSGVYTAQVFGENRLWQAVRVEEGVNSPPDPTRSRASETRPPPRNLLRHGSLTIPPGATLTARLIVTGQSARIEGLALRNGKPAAGAMIVLVPVDALDRPETYRRDQSDLDGTFLLPEVAPGRYIVVAIEDGWNLEWRKPEVLTPFLLKGTPLEISPTDRRPIHLPNAIPVQSLTPVKRVAQD